jgi:hypothetical protein
LPWRASITFERKARWETGRAAREQIFPFEQRELTFSSFGAMETTLTVISVLGIFWK